MPPVVSLLSAVVIFMESAYLEEMLEAYILYFFYIGCYDWIMSMQSRAPSKLPEFLFYTTCVTKFDYNTIQLITSYNQRFIWFIHKDNVLVIKTEVCNLSYRAG
jgi:hypothetical protein